MNNSSEFLKQIRKTNHQYRLFERGDRVLIGVSGGPDSMALLHAFNALRYEFGLELLVAHFNHGLRKQAGGDARFVQKACAQLKLPFLCGRATQKQIQKKGSVEDIARRLRFAFLIRTARRYRCDKIALAHNRDDLAETVLMRILRGAGLQGMRSILPSRVLGGRTFVRPLLNHPKSEILSFLKHRNISFRSDTSNRKTHYFRNKIRLRLLPLLEKKYQKNIKDILVRMALTSSIDYRFLEMETEKILNRIMKLNPKAKQLRLSAGAFKRLHPALQRMVIRLSVERLHGSTNRLTCRHIQDIEDLWKNKPLHSRLHLPFGLQIRKEPQYLTLTAKKHLIKSKDKL